MVYRTRIKYTAEQKTEIWDRWLKGESQCSIGRLFDRPSSSIYNILASTGGIRPAPRKRSRLALTQTSVNRFPEERLPDCQFDQLRVTLKDPHLRLAVKLIAMVVMIITEQRRQKKRHGRERVDRSFAGLLATGH
jgi:hypothetical protein